MLKAPPRRQEEEEEIDSPPKREEDAGLEGTSTQTHSPPGSPVSSKTRRQVLQTPLGEAVGPEGGRVMVKVPFSTIDLEAWGRVAKNYRSDPLITAKHLRYIIKQHNPDWSDIQLSIDALTETEKQLVLKTAGDLAEVFYKTQC